MGGEAPETYSATHKRQVINLWNYCILLVDLFESYDDPRTCERQKRFLNRKLIMSCQLTRHSVTEISSAYFMTLQCINTSKRWSTCVIELISLSSTWFSINVQHTLPGGRYTINYDLIYKRGFSLGLLTHKIQLSVHINLATWTQFSSIHGHIFQDHQFVAVKGVSRATSNWMKDAVTAARSLRAITIKNYVQRILWYPSSRVCTRPKPSDF
jgi:hypothetical protein